MAQIIVSQGNVIVASFIVCEQCVLAEARAICWDLARDVLLRITPDMAWRLTAFDDKGRPLTRFCISEESLTADEHEMVNS